MSDEKKKELEIAALAGVGIPLADIARATDSTAAEVSVVVEEKVTRNENGLGEVYDLFRAALVPRAQTIVNKAVDRLVRKVRVADTKELLMMIREIGPLAGLSITDEGSTTTRTRRVDVRSPEMVKALRATLQRERQASQEDQKLLGAANE